MVVTDDKNFNVEAALIGELFHHQVSDAQRIAALERECGDAIRVISALVAKYGKPDPLFPKRRTIRLTPNEYFDAPDLTRWDERENDEMVWGVTVNERCLYLGCELPGSKVDDYWKCPDGHIFWPAEG